MQILKHYLSRWESVPLVCYFWASYSGSLICSTLSFAQEEVRSQAIDARKAELEEQAERLRKASAKMESQLDRWVPITEDFRTT